MPATLTERRAATDVLCAHCTLPVPPGLVREGEAHQFCCGGCRTVWELLHNQGLDGYYRLAERRETPVQRSDREFAEFDHPAFQARYVRPGAGELLETELYLEGVHCSACVWLVERVPLVVPGVTRAELEVGRALAHLAWDPTQTSLSVIARFLDTLGYRPHPFRGVHADRMRRRENRAMIARIGVAGALAGNVMLLALAMYSGLLSGMDESFERYFRWLSLLLTTPALLWPGSVFFRGAIAALRTKALHIDLPIAIALAAGYARGLWNTVTDSGPVYFDVVAILVFLLLVGRFLQQRAQRAAADAAELLHAMAPAAARVVEGDAVRDVPTEALLPGMIIEVRPGDTVPADGIVVSGESALNAALLSGESRPVTVHRGERTWAGTINLTAPLRIRVEETGEASRVGRLLREMEAAARRRAPVVATANRLAGWFVAVTLGLAAITAALWWTTDSAAAIDHAIALLVVTCPCALALATPLAVSVGIGRAARVGILIKGGEALEVLGHGRGTIYLDKTGTLTEGRTALLSWTGPDQVRPLVLALEHHATHPIATGFQHAWRNLPHPEADTVRHTIGGGIEGRVNGRQVVVGSPAFVRARARGDLVMPADPTLTPVLVAVDGVMVGVAGFGDPIRPDARSVLDTLRARGWRVRLLSGDAPAVAVAVGARLGFAEDEAHGAATPEDKLAVIEGVTGGPVVMVGDGVNDAAAMARATVGIGVKGGAEACLAVADVYLNQPGLAPLAELIERARLVLRTVRRNIAFALCYNAAGVTLAMLGVLDPLVAAILMPVSSVTVILHSWLAGHRRSAPWASPSGAGAGGAAA